ncbi:ROK family protein [candidate division KSB1 bacterium]|nr:ROK family protein [candidate division KSB1 bacterium]
MTQNYYIGIDIGGTKTAVILMDEHGNVIQRKQFATDVGKDAWKISIAKINTFISEYLMIQEIRAIGISCGGPLDSKKGVILSPPNLPGWDAVPIVALLQNEFKLTVWLENDANAGALAEWKFGAGKGCQNLIFLTFGTGLGAGLILNGKLYSGTNDLGGEVGHIRLADDGPIGYHKRGSFEGFCSGTGLAQMMAFELLCLAEETGRESMLSQYKEPGLVTGKDVVDWAFQADPLALKVIQKSGVHLGKGLSILIDILNPEMIIIGSMGVRLGELLFQPAREIIEQEAISAAASVCKIVPASLGEKIGDYAALCVARIADFRF